MHVDDYLQVRVQHSDDDTTALVASASLGSYHVRLFGRGEVGVIPILAPQESTDWGTTINALGFTISSHTMITSVPHEKIEAIKRSLFEQWSQSGRRATARDVLSIGRQVVESHVRSSGW